MRIDSRAITLEDGRTTLLAFLRSNPVGDRARYGTELVFEEWMTNLRMHALHGDPRALVDVDVQAGRGEVCLSFSHDGPAFDPTTFPEPKPVADLTDTPVGGRGLLLIRSFARSMRYSHDGRRGTLIVCIDD